MINSVTCIRGESLHNDATPTVVQTSYCQLLQVVGGVQAFIQSVFHMCSLIIKKKVETLTIVQLTR